ncbi:MAG: DEAD/DEAH box helicase [Flavobacteriales bacterium]|jgi:ATP-dependent RNA helicase RhlE|nr:DEAD/DEAH box helicase [Flavobacteriales bacterium]
MMMQEENKNAFSHLGLRAKVLSTIRDHGFTDATAIQKRAIPAMLERKNMIGVARTGTGKTLSFLLPIIDQWLEDKSRQFLLLCPSKELAYQLRDELEKWRPDELMSYAIVSGGMKERSIQNLRKKNPSVIIANPGMLATLLSKSRFNLAGIYTMVMDEVDQMMEKSMKGAVEKILVSVPSKCQKAFFSATVPKNLKAIIEEQAKDTEWIEIQKHISNKLNIEEKVYYSKKDDKEELLFHLLYEYLHHKTILFFNDRFFARDFYQALKKADFQVEFLHGKKGNNTRLNSINRFRNNEFNILITTDVLGRGIDIPDTTLVINAEVPDNKENYEHRIGRTGRLGRKGIAISCICVEELQKFRQIQKLHKETIKEVYNHPFYEKMPENIIKTKLKNSGKDGSNVHRLAWNNLLKGK